MTLSVAGSQRPTVQLLPPHDTCPFGLNATQFASYVSPSPLRALISRPVSASQIIKISSGENLVVTANCLPSELNATPETCPDVKRSLYSSIPVRASQTRIVPSELPEAIRRPSG